MRSSVVTDERSNLCRVSLVVRATYLASSVYHDSGKLLFVVAARTDDCLAEQGRNGLRTQRILFVIRKLSLSTETLQSFDDDSSYRLTGPKLPCTDFLMSDLKCESLQFEQV